MLQVGKFNKLKVVKTVDFGVYLDGGEKPFLMAASTYSLS